jgi:PAS domain S-box-containing protein
VLNKLTAINETIDAITEGQRQDRIHMPGEDEFSALAGKFNFMIETINTLIRKSEDDRIFLQNLINSLDDGVLVVNLNGTVAMANKALLSDIGKSLDEVIGESCSRVKGQQHIPCSIRGDECPMRKVVQEGQSVRKIQKIHSKTKGERYFEVFAYPMRNEQQQVVQMIEIIRNITDQKNMEAQLLQSEKLSEIGILAANVAHEINNPMASITTCADGLLKRLPAMDFADPAIQTYFTEYLQTIRRAAFRCKDYTRHLLMFATPTEFHIEPVDMQEVFNDILILLHTRMKKESKDITLQLQNEHVRIPADRAQLSQVLLNLLTNALDATTAGGRILVAAAVDGDAILIRVEDNGCGIDNATREKIFEPFFTTKERGKGTGLGLCIVKSIVEKHHGDIRVTSAAAQGTVVEIRLPVEPQ